MGLEPGAGPGDVLTMVKRACAVLALSGLMAVGSASAATSPHAQARALLTRCLTALSGFPIVEVGSRSAAASRTVQARHVDVDCAFVLPMHLLARAHRSDRAMQDALAAAVALNGGVSDYVQYVLGVAGGRQSLAQLHRSQREVAAAKTAAHAALRELG
jgi:hypothetical protein